MPDLILVWERCEVSIKPVMIDLPLFPLNVVLFPGIPFQLHIFEERYKEMVSRCLDTDGRFGVVLIKDGVEALGPLAEPHPVGCVAQIAKVERLPEGRMNITVIGQERFQIFKLNQDRPYLVGQVEPYPFDVDDPRALAEAADGLRPWVLHYLRELTGDSGEKIEADSLPDDPLDLAFVAAYVLHTPPVQKQQLLAQSDALSLLGGLRELYPRETALLKTILQRQDAEEIGSFTVN